MMFFGILPTFLGPLVLTPGPFQYTAMVLLGTL